MKTPVSLKRIQNHFSYSWWKYVILAAVSIMGWSILFSVTAYRPPEEKKIILGVYSYGDETVLQGYMDQVWPTDFPDMEEMDAMYILPDETYGDMILSTRIAARDCDLYVLPREQFQGYAEQGGFMAIDTVCPELVAELEASGITLSRGWRTNAESGEKHLYGIHCADLPGALNMFGYDTSDAFISIFFETGNDDNVTRFFEMFIRELMKEPAAPQTVPAP
ncbi:MAG: hypothetical protein IJZ74_09735 [Clostridia bacterium]|nr:hypothetical protein [Clostridia bacterium]